MSKKKFSERGVFKCPIQKLVFSQWEDDDKHKPVINDHHFNHALTIIVPGMITKEKILDSMSPVLQQPYYRVLNLPVSKLIDTEFIEAFVKRGNTYMLSCDTQIDTSDLCMALHPPGILVLNVSKDIYEQLGLEGRPSHFNKKIPSRFVVTIDLVKPSFRPDKKNYRRIQWCLTNRLDLNLNVLVSWIPFDGTICPSSIGAYFRSNGFTTVECQQNLRKRQLSQLVAPAVNGSTPSASDGGCGYAEFYEWLGFVSCGCEYAETDGFVTTYSCPEPKEDIPGGAWLIKITGMPSPYSLLETVDNLRELIVQQKLPWISITAHGFADSPVSWSNREHGFHTNGDNLLTLVLHPKNSFWMYLAHGTNDNVS